MLHSRPINIRLFFILTVFWTVCSTSSFAQTDNYPKITTRFDNLSLKMILDRLDNQTPYSFYYKAEDLPKKRFTYNFEATPLNEVLDKILTPTTLSFLLYRDYAINIVPAEIALGKFTINYYKVREEITSQSVNKDKQQLEVGNIKQLNPSGNAIVKGIIRDQATKEPIIGATVMWKDLEVGTTTDIDGSFEVEMPAGIHYLQVSYIGFEELNRTVKVNSDGEFKIDLEKGAINLEEVTVKANKADESVETVEVSVTTLDIESVKKGPSFLGEADVVKSLLLTAGVSSVGEGASGFNVRGGDVDQNLILQNEGLILNSSHALGFFSSFNTDLVSSVKLYKANMPAQFGGRLSSVMDVKMRDGNDQEFKIKGGVGPVTSRLSLEGPIVKDKVSFIVGGRASYADWILNLVRNVEVNRSSVFFYDANLRLSAKLNKKNTLILSGYAAEDEFTYNEEFGFDYATYMGQLTLKTIFNQKSFSNLSLTYSDYKSSRIDFDGISSSRLENNVNYLKLKELFTFSPSTLLKIETGLSGILYQVTPGTLMPFGDESTVIGKTVDDETGLETAAFINGEYSLSDRILISAGLRLSFYQFLGPNSVYEYSNPDRPLLTETIGTTTYSSGQTIASYFTPEPRLSIRYRLNAGSSIKLGYSRTAQYISQIFNSDAPTPVAQWQLSTSYIKPLKSHNLSLGYFLNLKDNVWETSAEVYARSLDQLFDYRDFADLIANQQLETELLEGDGRSYGLEVSIRKKEGVYNGSLSYTWSRSERQAEGINRGDYYPSNFDKPHDLALTFNYQPNRRNTISINFIYGSGRPTTPPIGNYVDPNGLVIPVYAERNAGRIPDYHRLDIAYTLGQSYKRDRKFRTSWTLALYNVYGRENAFSVFFTQAAFRGAQANKLAILGSVFPSLTFNFELL